MTEPISRAEFSAFTDRLYKTIDSGFDGVNDRLDDMNSRTGDIEEEVAVLKAARTNRSVWLPPILGAFGGALVKWLWR